MFTGCSLTGDHNAYLEPQPFSKLAESSEWYEDQLSASTPEYNFDWQILLARAYSAEGDTNRAFEVIRQMREQAITPLHGNYADIIEAQVRSSTGNYSQALALLNGVDTVNLPQSALAYYYNLAGKVQDRTGNYAAAGQSFLNLAHAVGAADNGGSVAVKARTAQLCAVPAKTYYHAADTVVCGTKIYFIPFFQIYSHKESPFLSLSIL